MKIETRLDYQTILANHARPVHFALSFEAPATSPARPRPAAFCMVIDRSGSMAGQPLAKAREAALLALRHLRPEDTLAVVVFDDQAQTVVPLQQIKDRPGVARLIESITARGSTNLTAGWMLGRDELKKAPEDAARRLLLLSDGQLNVGIINPPQVSQVVASGLEHDRVRTSCLGFGDQYNEDLMAELARVTNGQFYDANSAEKLPAIFGAELEGLQQIVIQNLRVRLCRLDFCESAQPLGQYPSVALPDGRQELAAGDLISGESRVLCFELGVLPLPWVEGRPVVSLEGEKLVELEILYDEIGSTEIASRTHTQVIRIQATQNPDEVKENGEVISWVAMQKAARVMGEVNQQIDAGQAGSALARLAEAIRLLRSYGSAAQVQEALAILQSLQQKIGDGEWSMRERKLSKYWAHQTLKASSHEFWSSAQKAPSYKKRKLPPQNPGPDPNNPPPDAGKGGPA